MKCLSLRHAMALLLSPTLIAASLWTSADDRVISLDELTVRADPQISKVRGTSIISTIPGTPLSEIGSAVDVLGRLPLITVRQDNSISIAGKGTPEIYINGRPLHDLSELTRISSGDLNKVELLLAPGAEYSSTTTAVIRIKTLNRFAKGFSFSDIQQIDKCRKWSFNNMPDLNFRNNSWDFFLSGNAAHYDRLITGKTVNSLAVDGESHIIGSSQNKRTPSTAGSVKGGFNFSSEKISFGAYYRFNPERGEFENRGTEWIDNEIPLERIISNDITGRSHLVSLYGEATLAKEMTLHLDADFKRSLSTSNQMTLYPDGTNSNVNSKENKTSSLWAAKLYLKNTIGGGELTTGVQASRTETALDHKILNDFVAQYIPSGKTDASQTSAAMFAQYSRRFSKLDLSAGVRYEHTDYRFSLNGVRDKALSNRSDLLTPDISIGYSFNDRSQVVISYKMSTIRPPYSNLTNGLTYVGRHEIEGGNPGLKNERMHDLQIFGMYGDFMLQGNLTRSLDTYAFVKKTFPAPTLQLLLQPVNINVTSLDFYLMWSRQIGIWNPDITLGVYKQWLTINNRQYNRPILSYQLRNIFTLPAEFKLTLDIAGRRGGDMHTNRFGSTAITVDCSISRSFFKKAFDVRLAATDLFGTANHDWTMKTYGINLVKTQDYDTRGVTLRLTYRFNARRSKYKGQSASPDELRRI